MGDDYYFSLKDLCRIGDGSLIHSMRLKVSRGIDHIIKCQVLGSYLNRSAAQRASYASFVTLILSYTHSN